MTKVASNNMSEIQDTLQSTYDATSTKQTNSGIVDEETNVGSFSSVEIVETVCYSHHISNT